MGDVGPNFEKGARRIGRRRLPAGFVAILDDPQTLRLAGNFASFVNHISFATARNTQLKRIGETICILDWHVLRIRSPDLPPEPLRYNPQDGVSDTDGLSRSVCGGRVSGEDPGLPQKIHTIR
jgi:hypothetical protein